ncbi:integrase catalytic domain-containing protein [Trichonephila clavipes]|nr:integrase catalytic domain-containing protein [Trichonephila clavipes]
MANAKFELKGWELTDSNGSTPQPEISKVLGMLWNCKNDTLSCEVDLSIKMMEPFTQRKKAKLSWDDELPKDVTEKFKKWFKNLHLLKLVEIPRYMSMNDCVSISLHIFCDASKLSYATALFLRSESESQVSVQLVLAKSRIAPLKAMSIPKLELMACTIGVCLTDMNPADLPSRGCSAKKLIESRWWEGPQWLTLSEKEWPHYNPIVDKENVNSERRKVAITALNNVNDLSSREFSATF